MSVTVEKQEKNMVKLTIEVPAEEVAAAEQRAYQKNKGKIAVPGFRKGKAPRSIIEKMYGPDVFLEEAVNDILPDAYEAACKESGLEITSRPVLDYTQVEHGKSLIFVATVATKPEVTLGEYKGLAVDVKPAEVTDEDVEAALKKEQEKNATLRDVDGRPVQEGDTVTLNYAGTVNGVAFEGGTANEQELVIGSHQFIPGFEEQMVGMNIDEERDLNVKFPEAYHAKELAGKDAVFHVKVLSISEKELPELNDEFASDVSEFETLDAYKEDLKKKLLEQKEKEATAAKEDAVLAKAVENASMEIPDPMIESQAEDMVNEFGERLQMQGMQLEQYLKYTGMSMKQIVDQYKEQAKKRIQGRLVLEAIVKAENIEATEEDVEEGLKTLAADYQMDIDKVRGFFDDESMVSYKKDLATQKALDLIVAESK
ncbi:MAG: trigger factor [Lachnospiraceae bacterium]|nr:trigger factor [Lachnospiraceae bacterium]